jgi:hypothetical protein
MAPIQKENSQKISSYDSWTRLEEVWLGDCYPAQFYDHLAPEVRDCFYKITEITQEDLTVIQRKLESFDITVRRPKYTSVDQYLISHFGDSLEKPLITPRDHFIVSGNNLYGSSHPGNIQSGSPMWETIEVYKNSYEHGEIDWIDAKHCYISGANVVRVGRDMYFDIYQSDQSLTQHSYNDRLQFFRENIGPRFSKYRLNVMDNGGHTDGCFAVLKPGLLLASKYYDNYPLTFPGWELIQLTKPNYITDIKKIKLKPHNMPHHNGKWWKFDESSMVSNSFNQYIIDHALTWVGNYTETYFDLNCLVLDENNVMMMDGNHNLFEYLLKNHGINVHPVPFRTRTFWDGGLHCLTLDIRRQGGFSDYFPTRDDYKILDLEDPEKYVV